MLYRRLGRTNLRVSILGIGGGYLAQLERPIGERIYQRAFELGINYFDGRYGDSSLKLRPLLKQHREQCVVVSKTRETGAEGFMRRVEEDLRDCGTDYLDGFFLRTYSLAMLEDHLSPGGAFGGALKAREQGKIRFVGMANHGTLSVLPGGIRTGLVNVVVSKGCWVHHRRLVQTAPALLIRGRLETAEGVVNVVAETLSLLPLSVTLASRDFRWVSDPRGTMGP